MASLVGHGASDAIHRAHDRSDNFGLSIWREVRRILSDRDNE
jgi:hypothetical protein